MAFFLKQARGSKHHKANGGVQETNELLVGIEVWGNVDAVKAPATYATPPPPAATTGASTVNIARPASQGACQGV